MILLVYNAEIWKIGAGVNDEAAVTYIISEIWLGKYPHNNIIVRPGPHDNINAKIFNQNSRFNVRP